MSFFSGCFVDFFFFILSFQMFNHDVSWHTFLQIYYIWSLVSFFKSIHYAFGLDLGSIQLLFFRDCFHPCFLSSLLPELQWLKYVRSLRLCSFFFFSPFALLWWLGSIYCSICRLTSFFICPFHSVEPIHWTFHFGYYICQFQNIWCLFTSSNFLLSETFIFFPVACYFFICSKHVPNVQWSIFKITHSLEPLPENSNIPVISALASMGDFLHSVSDLPCSWCDR